MTAMQPPQPLSLALFELAAELHRSGSGAVFEATDVRSGGRVAIKRKDSSELGERKLLEHEAVLLATLSHPNVAVCLGSFVERGRFYMVLEFADRGDLGQLIQLRHRARHHLAESEIWGLFTQICAGVCCIHQQRIIHRDLKPRNVLLYSAPPATPDGATGGRGGLRLVAKIADLGVSRQLSATTEMATTFYGTPLYISPELCRNQPYTAKTDVWSLGVMLYECAALRPPFFGYSIVELAGAITRGSYSSLPSSYSSTLHESVRAMLCTSAAQRPTVDEYCQWLQRRLLPRAEVAAESDSRAAHEQGVPDDRPVAESVGRAERSVHHHAWSQRARPREHPELDSQLAREPERVEPEPEPEPEPERGVAREPEPEPELEPEPEPEPELEPVIAQEHALAPAGNGHRQPTTAWAAHRPSSAASAMSARDRRLRDRQRSYSARSARSKVPTSRCVKAPGAAQRIQPPAETRGQASETTAPQAAVGSQLSRLRASMAQRKQDPPGSPVIDTGRQSYGASGSSTVRRGYERWTRDGEEPHAVLPNSAGYIAEKASAEEVEVAGLPSHRRGGELDRPHTARPTSSRPSSSASSLRCPFEWKVE